MGARVVTSQRHDVLSPASRPHRCGFVRYNIPLPHLEERLAEVPRHRHVVVHCASGYRASIAASLLAQHGFTQVADLVGGFAVWEASKLETVALASGIAPQ